MVRSSKSLIKVAILLGTLLGMSLFAGAGMAKSEEYVCSAMTGLLVHPDGSPAAATVIRRDWDWHGKSGSSTATTDADGRFSFDAVPARRGFFGWLPMEDATSQRFYALLPGGEFNFLYIPDRSVEALHETDGKPFNVLCRLGVKADGDGFHWGTCELSS